MITEILTFLSEHNNGEYRSDDILFSDFLREHPEYIDRQNEIRDAINNCISRGYIKHPKYPDYLIYLTDQGRKVI